MKNTLSRRNFVRASAIVASAFASKDVSALIQERPSAGESSPFRLGLASYTFRNFSRAQMIGFLKQLNVFALNLKDVKDHLPSDMQQELSALSDYGHPQQIRILQASRHCRHCRRRPSTTNSAANREVRKRVRHPFRGPQSRAGGQVMAFAA